MYMIVVRQTDKADYWSNKLLMPIHPIVAGMSEFRLNPLWGNISFAGIYVSENGEQALFYKTAPFIRHIRNVSSRILMRPGLSVDVDEMMVQCSGRNVETHIIKNKPIY